MATGAWGTKVAEEPEEEEEEVLLEPSCHTVHVDALVLLKIMRHCPTADPALRAGSLLGMDVEGVQQVTNCYPLPTMDDDFTDKDMEAYHINMLRMLREVNVDNNCVGWYQTTQLGSFFNQTFIETQYAYQLSLGQDAVVLVYDPMQTSKSSVWLKAFRLTPAFMKMKMLGRDAFGAKAVAQEKLTPADILEEVPVKLRASPIANCLLADMGKERAAAPSSTDFDRLWLSTDPYLEKNLEYMCTWADELGAEMHRLQSHGRYAYRQKQEQARWLAKRTEENKLREEAGEEALPTEDPTNPIFKHYPEPSRLESLMISKQIGHYCQQINSFAGMSFSKLFLASSLRTE
jgi:translation initiation factor 3 subunit H